MRVLIVGGTGNISWRLTKAAVDMGWDVTVFNRGNAGGIRRTVPVGCNIITSDINDPLSTQKTLGSERFDAVVDFICYNSSHAHRAISYFAERTSHYIFISTTALYDRGSSRAPLSEASPLVSKGWEYALAKAQAEQVFIDAYHRDGFPVTILRPGHTYDTIIPDAVGEGDWTNPWRLLNGKPIVLHGDGTTLWTLTHSLDFANGIIEVLKSSKALGEIFQITSDEFYTWREITFALCRAINVTKINICFRTAEEISSISSRIGNSIIGHKMWCDIYDNRKFKSAFPSWLSKISLEEGMNMTIKHYQSNKLLLTPNPITNSIMDQICTMRSVR